MNARTRAKLASVGVFAKPNKSVPGKMSLAVSDMITGTPGKSVHDNWTTPGQAGGALTAEQSQSAKATFRQTGNIREFAGHTPKVLNGQTTDIDVTVTDVRMTRHGITVQDILNSPDRVNPWGLSDGTSPVTSGPDSGIVPAMRLESETAIIGTSDSGIVRRYTSQSDDGLSPEVRIAKRINRMHQLALAAKRRIKRKAEVRNIAYETLYNASRATESTSNGESTVHNPLLTHAVYGGEAQAKCTLVLSGLVEGSKLPDSDPDKVILTPAEQRRIIRDWSEDVLPDRWNDRVIQATTLITLDGIEHRYIQSGNAGYDAVVCPVNGKPATVPIDPHASYETITQNNAVYPHLPRYWTLEATPAESGNGCYRTNQGITRAAQRGIRHAPSIECIQNGDFDYTGNDHRKREELAESANDRGMKNEYSHGENDKTVYLSRSLKAGYKSTRVYLSPLFQVATPRVSRTSEGTKPTTKTPDMSEYQGIGNAPVWRVPHVADNTSLRAKHGVSVPMHGTGQLVRQNRPMIGRATLPELLANHRVSLASLVPLYRPATLSATA